MLVQMLIGAVLIVVTILVAGLGFVMMEAALLRHQAWLVRPPHKVKAVVMVAATVTWILLVATAGVWLWALTLLALSLFEALEPAVYFGLVAFTTLGFGDVLLPEAWRLLSGMAAINGLLMIGLQTAMMIELFRLLRRLQDRHRL
jgi:hypothetical protein